MRYSREDRLEIIRDYMGRHNGVFRPEDFLSEAESSNHPAHGWFNWDDGDAAHKFRVDQARQFARVRVNRQDIVVNEITESVVVVPRPALVSPIGARGEGGGYISTDTSAGMAALRHEARLSLLQWLARYAAVLDAQQQDTGHDLADTIVDADE